MAQSPRFGRSAGFVLFCCPKGPLCFQRHKISKKFFLPEAIRPSEKYS